MHCPFCGAHDTKVIDSRLVAEGDQVRRRRECMACEERFTTFETAELVLPRLIKSDGSRQPFDEDKLRRGIEHAIFKRPVPPEKVDHAIENVMRKLRAVNDREVPSMRIGEWVMDELRDLDHVAYVRFASIYRSFQDVNAFREEINRLEQLPTPEARRSQLPLIEAEPPAAAAVAAAAEKRQLADHEKPAKATKRVK